jgi:hypothetical protein
MSENIRKFSAMVMANWPGGGDMFFAEGEHVGDRLFILIKLRGVVHKYEVSPWDLSKAPHSAGFDYTLKRPLRLESVPDAEQT